MDRPVTGRFSKYRVIGDWRSNYTDVVHSHTNVPTRHTCKITLWARVFRWVVGVWPPLQARCEGRLGGSGGLPASWPSAGQSQPLSESGRWAVSRQEGEGAQGVRGWLGVFRECPPPSGPCGVLWCSVAATLGFHTVHI